MNHTWISLAPYGSFDHPQGRQTLSKQDAQRCLNKTRTWLFRLGIKKIPVYIGHPDDPLFQNSLENMNTQVYGYVKQLRCTETGISVLITWSDAGRELIQNRRYKYLSPRWLLSKTDKQSAYHPEALLSVGLTNHPHLPVAPILPILPEALPVDCHQTRDEKLAILRFTEKVHRRMEVTGESYPEAWHVIYHEKFA